MRKRRTRTGWQTYLFNILTTCSFKQDRALQRIAWHVNQKPQKRKFEECKNEKTDKVETLKYKIRVRENMAQICKNHTTHEKWEQIAKDDVRGRVDLVKRLDDFTNAMKGKRGLPFNLDCVQPELNDQSNKFWIDKGKHGHMKYALQDALSSLKAETVSREYIRDQKEKIDRHKHQYDLFSQFG